MTFLLIAYLIALVVPLLIATWRTSLLGLGIQGFLMAAMVAERGWPMTASGAILAVDLLLLRGYFVPRYLYGVLVGQQAPRRSDVIPANLISWTLAGALVLLAFRFADLLHPQGGEAAVHVAVAASGVLLGLLVLATQNRTLSQMVGALGIENGIALFELASPEPLPLPVQLGVAAILVLTVLTFGSFLRRLGAAPPDLPTATPLPARERAP